MGDETTSIPVREEAEEELPQDVQRAVHADESYETFLEKKRGAEDSDPEPINACTEHRIGRVDEVAFDEQSETVMLTVERHDGSTFTEKLDAALPDETGSRWVRLCDYVGADRTKPSSLYGERIPIRTTNFNKAVAQDETPDLSIDVPPVDGGLNMPVWSLRRWLYSLDVRYAKPSAIESGTVHSPAETLLATLVALMTAGATYGLWSAITYASGLTAVLLLFVQLMLFTLTGMTVLIAGFLLFDGALITLKQKLGAAREYLFPTE